MQSLIVIGQGVKIFFSSLQRKLFGFKQYQGSVKAICKAIIEDCWNTEREFFQVSAGHFNLFYMRDFGWCCENLLKLGYTERVRKTLVFCLKHYEGHGRVTTCITQKGYCFDFPTYSVDSLPYLLRCLRLLGDKALIKQYKSFLNKEIQRFYEIVVDKKSGMVKKNRHFSSMRDHAIRKSSCYDNCFVALLQKEITALALANPLKKYDYQQLLKKNFWNGHYFYADLDQHPIVTGDANLFPFYLGIFSDKKMLLLSMQSLVKEGLAEPLPLRYTAKLYTEEQFIFVHKLVKHYETSACWAHMGPIFINLLSTIDRQQAQDYLARYQKIVLRDKNFIEVYNQDQKPYASWFYYSDVSMLWAVNLLKLLS